MGVVRAIFTVIRFGSVAIPAPVTRTVTRKGVPMSNILFQITMGNGLALAIDKNNPGPGGHLIVMNANQSDPDQQWTWVYNPESNASILYNPGRNLYAAPKAVDKGQLIILSALESQYTGGQTFNVLSATKSAVQSAHNTDLNMNAFGDSWPAGTKVGLWTWGGGDQNEVWTSTIISP
jgi:hypothetical protein